jgi:hypothetical protein
MIILQQGQETVWLADDKPAVPVPVICVSLLLPPDGSHSGNSLTLQLP